MNYRLESKNDKNKINLYFINKNSKYEKANQS